MSLEEQVTYAVVFGLLRLDISFPGLALDLLEALCAGLSAVKG